MRELLAGMIVSAYVVAALFFVKFWARSRDRLFILLAVAFVMLAVQRALLVAWAAEPQLATALYGLRLAAFTLILVGIADKNR